MSIPALECSAAGCHRLRARDSRWCAPCGGPEEVERLRKIREASARMTYHPDDSLLDADAPKRERHDPQGWNYRHG